MIYINFKLSILIKELPIEKNRTEIVNKRITFEKSIITNKGLSIFLI